MNYIFVKEIWKIDENTYILRIKKNKAMIQVQKNDTLIDVIEKIDGNTSKEIILRFPLGHPILHNYLSLKIIKHKSSWKSLTIVTNDIISRKIGKKLWIHYSIIKDSEYIEQNRNFSWSIMKYNFSFIEYLLFEIKKYYREILSIIKTNKKINNIKHYSKKYKSYGNTGIFIALLLFSFALFVFIFYFAINKTTIIITPEITVKKKARNFTFVENINSSISWNDKNIKITQIEEKISASELYSTTWIEVSTMKKSQWKILVSNLLTEDIKLLPETRFSSTWWIVFQTDGWTSIPSAVKDNFWNITPGTTEILVTSQNLDINGKFIGERWNISKDTFLELPGMEDSGETIFAVAMEDFTWGENDFVMEVTQEDIDTAKLIFEQKLKNEVIKSLREKIQQTNTDDKTFFDILSVDNIIEYSNIEISIDNDIKVWDNVNNISLRWIIIWKTYIYDKKDVVNKLKLVVQESILKGVETILLIDDNSLRIWEIIYRIEEPLEIKATVEIDTLISHDFLNENNTYTEKLKETIKWVPKQEALKLLLNDPRISNVDITIRPFFLKNISNISENIVFEIMRN